MGSGGEIIVFVSADENCSPREKPGEGGKNGGCRRK